jgi:hypothetical protein
MDDPWSDRHVNNVLSVVHTTLVNKCDMIINAGIQTFDLESFIQSVKFVVLKCIILDDNMDSNYDTSKLDYLDNYSLQDQIHILCNMYDSIHNSMLCDIRNLQKARQTITQFTEINYMIGTQIRSIDTQIQHIIYTLSQSHDELIEYYDEFRASYDIP